MKTWDKGNAELKLWHATQLQQASPPSAAPTDGLVQLNCVGPEHVEGEIDGKDVEDDVSHEWALGERERLVNGHSSSHDGRHKHASTCTR